MSYSSKLTFDLSLQVSIPETVFQDLLCKVLDKNKSATNQVLKTIDSEFKVFLTTP